MVRARAAQVAVDVAPARAVLAHALEDDNVRVRLAATESLAGITQTAPQLVRRLMLDTWPMVRAQAAKSLATVGASELADRQLAAALQDYAPAVRQASAWSLGQRRATKWVAGIRDMAERLDEKVTLRITAVQALGAMCDQDSLDTLTVFARRAVDPYSPEAASGLSAASIAALGRLHPADLRKRLDVLLSGKNVAPQTRAAVEAALTTTERCPKR